MHFFLCESKRLLKFTGLKELMYENEDIQGYIADSAIVLAKKKDETQPQFTSHANSILFCIVRRNYSISGEYGKHGNHDAASADLNIILFFNYFSPRPPERLEIKITLFF